MTKKEKNMFYIIHTYMDSNSNHLVRGNYSLSGVYLIRSRSSAICTGRNLSTFCGCDFLAVLPNEYGEGEKKTMAFSFFCSALCSICSKFDLHFV